MADALFSTTMGDVMTMLTMAGTRPSLSLEDDGWELSFHTASGQRRLVADAWPSLIIQVMQAAGDALVKTVSFHEVFPDG